MMLDVRYALRQLRRGPVLRRVAAVSLAGLCAGLLLSFALHWVVASVLSVPAPHPVFFPGLLAGGMEMVALFACAAPALRAASVDPTQALMTERA